MMVEVAPPRETTTGTVVLGEVFEHAVQCLLPAEFGEGVFEVPLEDGCPGLELRFEEVRDPGRPVRCADALLEGLEVLTCLLFEGFVSRDALEGDLEEEGRRLAGAELEVFSALLCLVSGFLVELEERGGRTVRLVGCRAIGVSAGCLSLQRRRWRA